MSHLYKDLRNTPSGYTGTKTDDGGFIYCPRMPCMGDHDMVELPLIMEELGTIVCKEPIKIWIYSIDDKGTIYYQWDNGMDGEPIDGESPFLDLKNIEKPEDKIKRICQYDLSHAFFHYTDDPNYTYYHWALYGNYKDKVELKEE